MAADDRYPAIPLPAQGASGILNPNAGVGFFFSDPSGVASHQELLRRREMLKARAGQQRGFPKNIGEGLTSLGEAFGDRLEANRLTAQERAFGAAEDVRAREITGAPSVSVPGARTAPIPGRPTAELLDPAANDQRNRIAALGVASPNPTVPGVDTLPVTATGGLVSDDEPIWNARAGAIGGIESSGRYDTVSKAPTKYGHALGKYGVVEANVGPWTQAALGQPLTPQEFLANPQAQDAVFKHRFGQYVNQFGEEGAARAWFGGPGNVRNVNATDAYGRLSVGTYGQDYLRRLRGGMQPSGDPGEAGGDVGGSMTIDTATGADPNPITPSSIRPAPAEVTGRPGTRVVNNTLPSQSAVPPQTEQVWTQEPGPEPTPPDRVDFSPRQRKALEIMNNRGISPEMKAFAQQQFEIEEKIRTELTARREADYVNKRERWEKLTDEKEKFNREAPERNIKMMTDRGQFEKAQAELEKMYYERGLPREQAEQKAAFEIAQARRNLSEPKTTTLQGTQFSQNYDPKTGTWGPLGVTPGAPSPEGKPLTEQQAEGVRFVLRTKSDLDTIERDLNHGKVLTQWDEAARGNLPFVSKFTRSEDYAKARNAFNNFEGAFLKLTSGTAITPTEAALQLPAFIPQANDSDAELREKSRRRREFFEAVKGTTGAGGLEAIEKNIRANASEYDEGRKPPVSVATPAEAAALPPGRKILLPDGTIGVVPRRR